MRAEARSVKKGALGLMGLLAALVLSVPLVAQERERERQRDWDRERNWVFLGESHVDGARDRDRIRVGRYPESFRAILFRVEGGDVEFDRIKVHFRNGTAADRLMHVRIVSGGRTRAIDLPGERRIIESVEIWYRRTGPGTRPTVSLFGMR